MNYILYLIVLPLLLFQGLLGAPESYLPHKKGLFARIAGNVTQSAPISKLSRLYGKNFEHRLQNAQQKKEADQQKIEIIEQLQNNRPFNIFYFLSPASKNSAYLGKEAQTNVHIPQRYHIPITTYPNFVSDKQGKALPTFNALGFSTFHLIALSNNLYGHSDTRTVLHHEAIHTKYNDMFCLTIALPTTCHSATLSATLLAIARRTPIPRLRCITTVLAGTTLLTHATLKWAILPKYRAFCEHRADYEGHYATQCHECLTKTLLLHPTYTADEEKKSISNGYLSTQEKYAIAQHLKEQNKLCAYHKKPWIFRL